ncbi:hypothetical protein [Streptomyces sp. NPDC003720]|uniref:hypothetical protein n=1 Tax=Streptomyces sp. NPDC003720 TaxID=3364684 RepID=UPI0036954E8F
MGERLSGEGLPGRRRGHPGGTVLGSAPAGPDAGFEARIAAALRGYGADGVDPEAERRAVAAFRAARASGQRPARTRRRDDWRPGRPRRARLSVRTTLSVFLASLALGGVAFAAIGSPGFAGHDDGGGTGQRPARPPVSTAPRQQAAEPAGTASAAPSGRPDRPATAQDLRAHCRAYEQVRGRGKALDSTAWQRLVVAAGGEDDVAGYCAARAAGSARPTSPARTGRPDNGTGNGAGDGTGNGADSGSGNGSGNGAGSGTAGGSGDSSGNKATTGGSSGQKAAGPDRADGKN